MSPRPLRRLKSFWAGVIVTIFLAWAWLVSTHYAHKVLIGPFSAPDCRSIGQSGGMFGFAHYYPPSSADLACCELVAGSARGRISLWRDPHGNPRYEIPPPIYIEKAGNGWCAGISHWLVLVAFWGAWIGGLKVRARRWKRHIEGHGQAAVPVPAATFPATPEF